MPFIVLIVLLVWKAGPMFFYIMGRKSLFCFKKIVRASFQGHRGVHVSLNSETAGIIHFKLEDFKTDPIQIVIGFAPCQFSYDRSKLCEKYKRDSYPLSEKGNFLLKKTNIVRFFLLSSLKAPQAILYLLM